MPEFIQVRFALAGRAPWRCLIGIVLTTLLTGPASLAASEPGARQTVRSSWLELESWLESPGGRSGTEILAHRSEFASSLASDSPDWFVVQKLGTVLAGAAQDLDSDVVRRCHYDWNRWLDDMLLPTPAELAARARFVARQEPSVVPEEFEPAARRLRQDLSRLQTRLSKTPEDQGWTEYLQLPQLQTAIRSRESVASQWPSVDHLSERFRVGAVAWPTQDLVQAARSLAAFSATARVHSDAGFHAARKTKLKRLARLLADPTVIGGEQPSHEVAEICQWLRDRGADPALVAGVYGRYVHPNFVLHVSNRALATQLDELVDEAFPVDDIIAGTRVRGRGRITGKMEAHFIPSVGEGILELSLAGKTVASTVGLANGATVRSTGVTEVQAVKRVMVDAAGLRQLPASVTANTRISYDSVSVSRLFARQQILSRVYASRSRAESDSARATAAFVRSEMNERVDPLALLTNERLRENVLLPLTRRLVWPETHAIQSGPAGLTIELLQRQPDQFGAPGPAPQPTMSEAVQLMIHSSFPERLLSRLVQGKTVDGTDLHRALHPPEAGAASPEADDAWSITFEEARPVSVAFQDDTVRVVLRLATLHADERDRAGMEVAGDYRLVLTDGCLAMVRDGEFQIYPLDFVPGEQRLSGPQLVTRQILRRKLEVSIPREIDLTAAFRQDSDSSWACDSFAIQDGWLVLTICPTAPQS